MSRGRYPRSRLWVAGFALAGIVGAHFLAYVIAVPHAHARRSTLELTGHGYWPLVVAAAVVALVASLAAVARRAAHARAPGYPTEPYWSLVLTLLGLQAAGFVVLEGVERAFVAGHSLAQLATEPAFVIGLALQVAVAFLGALVVVVFSRAVRLVSARLRARPRSRDAVTSRPYELLLAPASVAAGPAPLRGPPLRC